MTTSTAAPVLAATLDGIRNCILALRGNCDGAFEIDGAGFSKHDAATGHDFARRINDGANFSPKQLAYMASLAIKYRRQLAGNSNFDEAAFRALIDAVKSGNFVAPADVAAPEPKTDPSREFVTTFGAFVKVSDSGKASRFNFGNGRHEWIPNSALHPDDGMVFATRLPSEFRVQRWIFEEKRLPSPPKAQPALAATAAVASAPVPATSVSNSGNMYRPATAPVKPATIYVIE